jgi:hypothetical protein
MFLIEDPKRTWVLYFLNQLILIHFMAFYVVITIFSLSP